MAVAAAAAGAGVLRFNGAAFCFKPSPRLIALRVATRVPTCRRGFFCLSARWGSPQLSNSALGLQPLRSLASRGLGFTSPTSATAQSESVEVVQSQFPRPSSVPYDKTLANSIHLIGSVGVNPDIKYLDSGRIVATSSLSVKKTPQGDPTWFFLEFQSDLAEIAAQHVRKGDRIHVAGRVVVDSVSDKDDVSQVLVKVDVTELHFVEDVYGTQAQALSKSSAPRLVVQHGTFAQPQAVAASSTPSEKRQAAENTWKTFCASPGDWYDNRENKRNPRAPDFKHKASGDALWIEGYYTPDWVRPRIAELQSKGLLKKVAEGGEVQAAAGATSSTAAKAADDEFKLF